MFNWSKRRRQCASVANSAPAAEALESKALLSVNAVVQNGTLQITGTDGPDGATVEQGLDTTLVKTNGGRMFTFRDRINSIVANMGGGKDTVYINTPLLSYNNVSINMGRGFGDTVDVSARQVQSLRIDCSNSTDAWSTVWYTSVNTLNANFGSGQDKLRLAGSAVDQVFAEMGRGNDFMELGNQSRIRAGRVNMGDGNDEFALQSNSKITAEVSGGSGRDIFRGFRQDQPGTRLRDFEEINWWS